MDRKTGTSSKHAGLSKGTIRHSMRRSGRQTHVLLATKQAERHLANEAKRRLTIQELSHQERDAIEMMDIDIGTLGDDVSAVSHIVPPGDEGFDISHEGGEFEVFDNLVHNLAQSTGYHRVDYRDRRDRIENESSHWEQQIDKLVNAYLDCRARDGGDGMPKEPANPSGPTELAPFSVEVVDIFLRQQPLFSPLHTEVWPNETLIRHGFLGCSPLHPTVAISLRTLAAYRQSHRACPRFSLEAQCKMLCHLHNVPYRPYLCTQFSAAYDVYLELCHRVNCKINHALGHDTPNWRLRNCCPACFYKLEDEPQLEFSSFLSIDGNNSLKRLGEGVRNQNERPDFRTLVSDRWLSPKDVDRFKDEVKSSKKKSDDRDTDDWEDDSADPDNCIKRWRNAGPEDRKKMFALFDESGVFIASCQHRFVLLVCDMIRSGELAKYPLAMIDRLLEVLGSDLGLSYDIACALDKTARNSSLRSLIEKHRLRLMTGAFHGHAHNRACQLDWHPLYIKGTANSDGEGCEHVFSSSNHLATGTRHASRFHRHQAILEHFDFWDDDKYAALSHYLWKHYNEALDTIFEKETELNAIQVELGITNEDFEQYLRDEKKYLQELTQPSADTTLKIQYVQALRELFRCNQEWSIARGAANQVLTQVAPAQIQAAILHARHHVDSAYTKLQNAETLVCSIEGTLNICERWTTSSPDYQTYYEETVLTKYRSALDELERLVVMRLFELAKMSTSGTGYKLRQQIGKALQRRSEAIRNAITRYNEQAAKLNPPRPPLSWKEIAEYSFLGEFHLLRHARDDIRREPWAQPAHRAATVKYLYLCRAREKIIRLNVEIRRLRTSIHDETAHTEQVIADLSTTNLHLCSELQCWWALRSSVNRLHLHYLDEIEKLPGFSGQRGIGVRLGARNHVENGYGTVNKALSPVEQSALLDPEVERQENHYRAICHLTELVLNIRD